MLVSPRINASRFDAVGSWQATSNNSCKRRLILTLLDMHPGNPPMPPDQDPLPGRRAHVLPPDNHVRHEIRSRVRRSFTEMSGQAGKAGSEAVKPQESGLYQPETSPRRARICSGRKKATMASRDPS